MANLAYKGERDLRDVAKGRRSEVMTSRAQERREGGDEGALGEELAEAKKNGVLRLWILEHAM